MSGRKFRPVIIQNGPDECRQTVDKGVVARNGRYAPVERTPRVPGPLAILDVEFDKGLAVLADKGDGNNNDTGSGPAGPVDFAVR